MKTCKDCETVFVHTFADERYCQECRVLQCAQCGQSFTSNNHHGAKPTKFCTRQCYYKWQSINIVPPSQKGTSHPNIWNKGKIDWGVMATCPNCEDGFRIQAYRILKAKQLLYCSAKCRSAVAVSPEHKRLRRSKAFAEWRKAVFERDDYTCQSCGERGGELHPDHIKQFAYYPELRFELSNGRTLCANCHRSTPTWGYHGKAVAEQWDKNFQS